MRSRAPFLAAIGCVLWAAACAAPPTEDVGSNDSAIERIVGGTTANLTEWPGMVHLEMGGNPGCGGTLVADGWVLTAAHCLQPGSANGGVDTVVIGRQNVSGGGGERIPVARAFGHTGFSKPVEMDNDIALLQLSKRTTRPKVRLVTATEWAQIPKANLAVTVIGWGLTQEGGSPSDTLRQVTVGVVDDARCKSMYQGAITQNMLCAATSAGGRDSCQGDSGGPLFTKLNGKPVQIGVVSFGEGCARADKPGVYTRLANYLDWMKTTSGGAVVPGTTAPPPSDQADTEPLPSDDDGASSTSDEDEATADDEDETAPEEEDEEDTKAEKAQRERQRALLAQSASACHASRSPSSSSSSVAAGLLLGVTVLASLRRRRR